MPLRSLLSPSSGFSIVTFLKRAAGAYSSARSLATNITHDVLHRRRRQVDWRMSKMKPQDIRMILNAYDSNDSKNLKPSDFARISALLTRHPLVSQILKGYQMPSAIRVTKHPAFNTPCFVAILPDGTSSIFSYQLCVRGSTTTSLWRIFSDACRQSLFEAGLIEQVKTVTRDFSASHPGRQIAVQYNQIFQQFSLEQGLVLERPEQLLRLVDRDDLMRWRLADGPVRSELINYFGAVLQSPTESIFQVIGCKNSRLRVAL